MRLGEREFIRNCHAQRIIRSQGGHHPKFSKVRSLILMRGCFPMVKTRRNDRKTQDRSKVIHRRIPTGPAHALDAAVAVLGPYPWKRLDQLDGADRTFELPKTVTADAIREEIQRIGTHYQYDLEVDAAAVRIKDAFAAFEEIADLAEQLADRLSWLSETERVFLILSTDADEDGMKWVRKFKRLLPRITLDAGGNKMSEGAGAEWLRRLGEYTRMAVRKIGEYVEAETSRKGDVGGRFHLVRTHKPSPNWLLVQRCWQLFEWAPHCLPSGTAYGPLHEFMCHVHEWVTGENVLGTSKFESHLKAFAKAWQHRRKCLKDYADFKNALPQELGRELDSVLRGKKRKLRSIFPEQVLKQAEKLHEDVIAAERQFPLAWR